MTPSISILKTFFFSILLLPVFFTAYGQQVVQGKVTDAQKLPVPYATVMLKTETADSVLRKTVLTDQGGLFSITGFAKGKTTLSISCISYTTLTQEITLTATGSILKLPDFVLSAAKQTLNGVTISARKPLIQQKTDRIIMNITGSVLASGNNAYQILAMAPVVELAAGSLSMNGKSNVMILLNGRKIPNTTLENLLSSIPGDQIERIEFITNPSSKYDANASGGVIEIYTKRSTLMGWTASVGGNLAQGYRFGGGGNADFNLTTKKIDFSISSGLSRKGHIEQGYSNRKLFEGLTETGRLSQQIDIDHGINEDKNLNAGINYHSGKSAVIGMDINLIQASLSGTGNMSAQITEKDNSSTTNTFNQVLLQIGLSNYNLFYKKTLDSLGSNLLVTANYALYNSRQKQQFNQNTRSDSGTANYHFRNNAPSNYHIYTTTADYTKKFKDDAQLEAGLKYTFTENKSSQHIEVLAGNDWIENSTALQNLGYQEHIYAGYFNYYKKIGKFSFQAGIRAEQSRYKVVSGIDSGYVNLFPNLRAEYQVSKNYQTSLSYAKNINRPSYEDLIPYEFFIDIYSSRRGNAFLRPEYAHSYSWNNSYKKYSFNISYTRTADAISNILLYDQTDLRFIQTQRNFLSQKLLTASLSLPVKISPVWEISNRVTGYRREIRYPGVFNPDEIIHRNKSYYRLSTFHTFSFKKGYAAELSAYYNSPSISSVYRYGAYSNMSAGIRKSLFNQKAFIKLDVSDIFYKNNVFASSDLAPAITSGINRTDTRRVRLSFRYSFDKSSTLKRDKVQTEGNAAELGRLPI